jgi:hypothetical protein
MTMSDTVRDGMRRWDDIECPACGSADIDLATAIPGPLFVCQECDKHFDPPTDKPVCPLVGTDGNVFAIIGTVSRCLRRAGKRAEAKAFVERATRATSYDAVLQMTFEYVDPM